MARDFSLACRGAAACVAGGLALAVAGLARGGDWPQILGPSRNGVAAADERLAETWPAEGPRVLWKYPRLGYGFAGPAVAQQRVVVFHRVSDQERVEALDAASGRQLWTASFPATYRGGVNPDLGPRCVPLIHQDRVYVFGAAGDLHCLSLADGSHLWSRSLYADCGADEGYFGAGSTPIVAGDKLLVNVGGRDGAGIVALALDSGKTVWQVTDERASYSSPAPATLDAKPCVIFVTRLNTLAVDPGSGEVRFRFPFGQRGPTVNAATPLVLGDRLFLSASYGVGAVCADIRGLPVKTIWSNDESMSSQFATAVYHNGFLYGIHGREDIGRAALRCVDAETGRVEWSQDDFGVGHPILVGDTLLVLNVEGRLVIARATSAKFEALANAQVSRATTRALPALAGGRFYFRDNRNAQGQLVCLSVGT